MRGRPYIKKREILPDPKYKSILVAKFVNKVMLDGQKETARKIIYGALEKAENQLKKPAMEIFETALKNLTPLLEVKSKRIGGATYQVPMEVKPERKITLAMRWMIGATRNRQGKPTEDFLAAEIIDAYNNTGEAMKKRETLHRMAEANRAFAHFARF